MCPQRNWFHVLSAAKFGVCFSGVESSVNTFSVALVSVERGGCALVATKGVVKQDLLK